jgi:putative ABC transport system ATP-binding protein
MNENPATDSIITLRDLRFAWPRARDVLDIPLLQVARGERLFLQGPSGSGKSTLLGLLGGVLIPQHGSIEVLGQSLEKMSGSARDRFRAEHIGFVFQMFNLLPYLSLIENITLPCRFSPTRAKRAHAHGGSLQHEAIRLLRELGLDANFLNQRSASELSVGQQQRVAVARALIGAPEILIADEPTSALDTDTRESFLKLLFDECARVGTTLIFVSHDLGLAPLFSRTLKLAAINRTRTFATVTAA